jgi:hypothetical protein
MNNEPVAWMVKAPDGEYLVFENTEHPVMADCQYIPLYTHPAKTLTDEEILKMAADKFHYSEYRLVIEFARAILRKASEK